MKKKLCNIEKGITLIALIITIVILIILSTIAIGFVFGDNGLITITNIARDKTIEDREKEEINLAYSAAKLKKIENGEIGTNITDAELNSEFEYNKTKANATGNVTLIVTFEETNNSYIINQDGEIEKDNTEKVNDQNPGELSGDGDINNPYKILSIEDLIYFANQVNSGNNYEGKVIELGVSLNFSSNNSYALESSLEPGGLKEELTSGEGFEPMGTYWYIIGNNETQQITEKNIPYIFKGTFDGKNNSLINLYINRTREIKVSNLDEENIMIMIEYFNEDQSLFGVNNGNIINLNIENANLNGDYNVAGICGINQGVVDNCHITGKMNSTGTTGRAAGIVGENIGDIKNSTVKGELSGTYSVSGISGTNYKNVSNCINYAKINENNGYYTAGIVSNNTTTGTVENCLNVADVKGEILQTDTSKNPKCAGIVAYNEGNIIKCVNTGNITQYGYRTYIGGISGYTDGRVSQCYSTGNILANGGYCARIGGLVGTADEVIIENCYNTGKVTVIEPAKYTKIGGIAGETRNQVEITNCYNIGNISGVGTGYLKLGGLIGECGGTVKINNGFYLNTVSSTLAGTGTPELINSGEKTEQELKAEDFILIQEFGDIWKKDENTGYPTIK